MEVAQFVGIDGYNLFTDPARLGTFLPDVASDGSVYLAPPDHDYLGDGEKILTAPIGRDTINTMEAPRRGEGRANHEKADC